MQDMIKRIVEADSKARKLDEENRRAAEVEKQKIEQDAEAIYRKYMDETQAEIEKNDANLENRYNRKLRDVSAKQESVLIKLRSDYEQNCDKWVDALVERVLA